jgi:hypothetical protein
MNANYLINDLWWDEPIKVQQENLYSQIYYMFENPEHLPVSHL